MLEIKLGVNLVKLGVGSKTGSKHFVLAFQKCTDGSVLAILKCTYGSVLIFLKCMNGSVLAHLRLTMQSAPTRFSRSGNSEVPQLLCKKSTKISYLKQNEINYWGLGGLAGILGVGKYIEVICEPQGLGFHRDFTTFSLLINTSFTIKILLFTTAPTLVKHWSLGWSEIKINKKSQKAQAYYGSLIIPDDFLNVFGRNKSNRLSNSVVTKLCFREQMGFNGCSFL